MGFYLTETPSHGSQGFYSGSSYQIRRSPVGVMRLPAICTCGALEKLGNFLTPDQHGRVAHAPECHLSQRQRGEF